MNDLTIKPELSIVHGYSILFIPIHKKTIHIECAINNGFITESKKTAGINHLLEHVLSESWKGCKGNCYKLWNNIGVDMNAMTSNTVLKYYTSGLEEDTEIMLNYMIDIMEKPIFTEKTIANEKKAVINELLEDKSTSNLINFFNKHFYILEGLKNADNNDLQIKNLKHLTLKDLKQVFLEYYNKNNIVFVVSGQYNKKEILKLFDSKLKKYSVSKLNPQYCFSNKNDILFLKKRLNGFSNIMFGFPCTLQYNHPHYLIIPTITLILKDLLFNYLRTEKNLIYSVDVSSDQTICGTVVYVEVGTQDENVKNVIQHTFNKLNELKHMPIAEDQLDSIKKKYKFKSYTSNIKPSIISNFFIEQYLNQIYMSKPKFYSVEDIMNKVNHLNKSSFKSIMNTLFDFTKCLCVYYSNKDLKLKINDFITV